MDNINDSAASQVHPRIRGEYFDPKASVSVVKGSPPHTRGILSSASHFMNCLRFTPAYAGNTASLSVPSSGQRVHPRIRGEYLLKLLLWRPLWGSPPHTRGIPNIASSSGSGGRFTPAYAGNTRSRNRPGRSGGVHPRIRGEYQQDCKPRRYA